MKKILFYAITLTTICAGVVLLLSAPENSTHTIDSAIQSHHTQNPNVINQLKEEFKSHEKTKQGNSGATIANGLIQQHYALLHEFSVVDLDADALRTDVWLKLANSHPITVIELLNDTPQLLTTMNSDILVRLFAHYPDDIFSQYFLTEQALTSLKQATTPPVFHAMFMTNSDLAIEFVGSLTEGSELKKIGIYELIEHHQRYKSATELLDIAYDSHSNQFKNVLAENFANYDFDNIAQQINWIYQYDTENLFGSTVDKLMDKYVAEKSVSDIEFAYTQIHFKEKLLKAAVRKYSKNPEQNQDLLRIMRFHQATYSEEYSAN